MIRPNVVSYNAMLSVCGKCGRVEEAISLFEEMKEEGVEPDHFTYSILISTCESQSMESKAIKLFEEGLAW